LSRDSTKKVQPIGLDIGTSTVKAMTDHGRRVIFPSVYCKRLVKTTWDAREKQSEEVIFEGVGQEAIELAKHNDAIVIRPIIEGTIKHEVAVKLVQEAYRRLDVKNPASVVLVTGLPYDVSVKSINYLEQLLGESLGKPLQMAIYPQSFGTLIECGLESATIINIGHSTTGLLLVEDLTVLGGGTEPKATDYVVEQVRNNIIKDYGLIPSTETTRDLIISKEIKVGDAVITNKVDSIYDGHTVVTRKDIEPALTNAVDFLCEKIAFDITELHAQLPTMNLGCVKNIILGGGFSALQNPYSGEYLVRDSLEAKLKRPLTYPDDPLFSEASGYYKMATELAGT